MLVEGPIPRRYALIAAVTAFLLAIPLGLYLRLGLGTGPLTIPLGVLAIFIGWFYTAPPIRARSRGFGELFVAVAQGLVTFGAYYVQQGFSTLPWLVSLPWFLTLPAHRIIREFPDFETDRAAGRRGLALRFGRERMARMYDVLISLAVTSFVSLYFVLRSPTFWAVLVPVYFLLRSVTLTTHGGWREPWRARAGAAAGFIGMILIPLALTVAFAGAVLLR